MINKNFKLDLACGKDDLRPVMQYVLVTKEKCVATDAHIMAIIPTNKFFKDEFIASIPEEGMLIHREDWKKMLPYTVAVWKTEGEVIKCLDSKKRPLLIEVESQEEVGKYPNWEAVIPTKDMREGAEVDSIGLNLEIAATLQKALGLPSCKLDFSGKGRAIYLTAANEEDSNGQYGIVMPVMIKE